MTINKNISINGRDIGVDFSPYVIAELSANHNGNIETAKNIIRVAKQCGADAVKMQTYRPDTLTIKSDLPDFQLTKGLWAGRSLYDLYDWAHTPWEWHKPLFEFARSLDLTIFSSPFDETAVDLLEDLNAPAYKIASFEAVDLSLIKYVASTKKPMIISTGMANAVEIKEAIEAAYEGGCKDIAILHCVSGYPAASKDYNLKTIADMYDRHKIPVGISDHTLDNVTAISAVSLGACIVEKHVTMNRNGGGPDDSFSLEPADLEALCQTAKVAWEALGRVNYERKASEKDNVKFRRSLYFVRDVKKGSIVSEAHVKSIRPGYGLPPKYFANIIGKTLKKDVVEGTRVAWDLLDD